MKRRLLALLALLATACVPPKPVTTRSAPPRPIAFHTCISDLSISIDGAGLPQVPMRLEGWTDTRGDIGEPFLAIPATVNAFNLHINEGGANTTIEPYQPVVQLPPGNRDFFIGDCQPDQVGPTVTRLPAFVSTHVDPSGIPLEQLAAIRGAMWPLATGCNLSLPFGPRPGSPDNVIATGFMANYAADDQLKIVDCLKSRGYTHVVMGPLVDSDGYHGQYEAHDWRGANFDRFLDTAQFFWDHGLEPVVFIHPDGWTFEQTRDELTPLLLQPRAQRLIRIVVPTGWEPTRYGWSSCTWTLFFQWARQTLPNALVLAHSVNDTDGLVGTDERCDDNGKPVGEGWAREVPYLHGWLIQNGPYGTSPADNPELARNFAAQFMASGDGAQQHSVAWHFAGHVGWPTTSAWGDRPILLYAGEVTAYTGYWNNLAESIRVQWGDLAVRSGAAGYLDGGTIAVR